MVDYSECARLRYLDRTSGRLWPAALELLEVLADGGDTVSPLRRRRDDPGGDGLSLPGDDAGVVEQYRLVVPYA